MPYEKLTPKQEEYTNNLFFGMSQRKAYIGAGYSDKGSDANIDSKASALVKDGKVMARLAELR